MTYLPNLVFAAVLAFAIWTFAKKVGSIRRNILLGKDEDRSDQPGKRWKNMLRVAFGQSKMQARPVAGILHFIVYASFLIINLEVVEIILDGLLGTHRLLAAPLGALYTAAINFFEVLAVLTLVAVVVFWWRRNVLKLSRFQKLEMKGWAFKDANNILYIEVALMLALLNMNAVESLLPGAHHHFLVSSWIAPLWSGAPTSSLYFMERFFWWIHILGILAFLNYLPYSKHFHIILAFPNTSACTSCVVLPNSFKNTIPLNYTYFKLYHIFKQTVCSKSDFLEMFHKSLLLFILMTSLFFII